MGGGEHGTNLGQGLRPPAGHRAREGGLGQLERGERRGPGVLWRREEELARLTWIYSIVLVRIGDNGRLSVTDVGSVRWDEGGVSVSCRRGGIVPNRFVGPFTW